MNKIKVALKKGIEIIMMDLMNLYILLNVRSIIHASFSPFTSPQVQRNEKKYIFVMV